MRLLNVHDLSFREFYGDNTPPYVITSHRWSDDEATFKDVLKKRNTSSKGWAKIQGFCERVRQDNEVLKTLENATCSDWLWIDTACIDQRSTAEVSESINSMFRWYNEAVECHAYLADVLPFGADRGTVEVLDDFAESEWFQRGWTLQELLAPRCVIFFTQAWEVIGHKCSQCDTKRSCEGAGPLLNARIAQVTGIPETVLRDFEQSRSLGIEEKMKWQLGRRTTRLEDQAYCLLGIFDVNIPLIYGEGLKAIERLERTIFEELQRPWKSQLTFDLAGAFKASLVTTSLNGSRNLGRPLAIMQFSDVDGEVACVCGYNEDDGNLIACDNCEKWQHLLCYFGPEFQDALTADLEHRCFTCNPRTVDANLKGARRRQRERRNMCVPRALETRKANVKRKSSPLASPQSYKRHGRDFSVSTAKAWGDGTRQTDARPGASEMPLRLGSLTQWKPEPKEMIRKGPSDATQIPLTTMFSKIMAILVEELKTDESEFLDNVRFEDLGVDSLMALTISGMITEKLDVTVSPAIFTMCPTVGELKTHFNQSDVFAPFVAVSSPPEAQFVRRPASATSLPSEAVHLRHVVAEVLGVHESAMTDSVDLTALGMNDTMGASVLRRLRDTTGIDLPSDFLITNPTIKEIEHALGMRPNSKAAVTTVANASTLSGPDLPMTNPPFGLDFGSAGAGFEFTCQDGQTLDNFDFDSFLEDGQTLGPPAEEFVFNEPAHTYPLMQPFTPTEYTGWTLQPYVAWDAPAYVPAPQTYRAYVPPTYQPAASLGSQQNLERTMTGAWNSAISLGSASSIPAGSHSSLNSSEPRSHKCPIPTCEYHAKGFVRAYDLNRHTLTHFRGTIACNFCSSEGTSGAKTFSRVDVLKRHLTSVHGVTQTAPGAEISRNEHAQASSLNDPPNWAPCSLCMKSFQTPQLFYHHLDKCVVRELVPTPESSNAYSAAFMCPKAGCTSSFRHRRDLQRHLNSVHDSNEELKRFDCPFPGCEHRGEKAFLRRDHLMRHQRAKHGVEIQHRSRAMRMAGWMAGSSVDDLAAKQAELEETPGSGAQP